MITKADTVDPRHVFFTVLFEPCTNSYFFAHLLNLHRAYAYVDPTFSMLRVTMSVDQARRIAESSLTGPRIGADFIPRVLGYYAAKLFPVRGQEVEKTDVLAAMLSCTRVVDPATPMEEHASLAMPVSAFLDSADRWPDFPCVVSAEQDHYVVTMSVAAWRHFIAEAGVPSDYEDALRHTKTLSMKRQHYDRAARDGSRVSQEARLPDGRPAIGAQDVAQGKVPAAAAVVPGRQDQPGHGAA